MSSALGLPLLGIALVLVLVLGWNAYNATKVDFAVARVHATISGQALPEPAYLAGEWLTKALVNAVVGSSVAALVGALIIWLRGRWSSMKPSKWKSGQYAYWGRQPAPRAPSEEQLFRMAMMQSLMAGRGQVQGQPQPRLQQLEVDDEPTIRL